CLIQDSDLGLGSVVLFAPNTPLLNRPSTIHSTQHGSLVNYFLAFSGFLSCHKLFDNKDLRQNKKSEKYLLTAYFSMAAGRFSSSFLSFWGVWIGKNDARSTILGRRLVLELTSLEIFEKMRQGNERRL
ncbi:hypothetical protein EBT16_12870, partial [bacterium]|nr:hypothetical protein [bacterium]